MSSIMFASSPIKDEWVVTNIIFIFPILPEYYQFYCVRTLQLRRGITKCFRFVYQNVRQYSSYVPVWNPVDGGKSHLLLRMNAYYFIYGYLYALCTRDLYVLW